MREKFNNMLIRSVWRMEFGSGIRWLIKGLHAPEVCPYRCLCDLLYWDFLPLQSKNKNRVVRVVKPLQFSFFFFFLSFFLLVFFLFLGFSFLQQDLLRFQCVNKKPTRMENLRSENCIPLVTKRMQCLSIRRNSVYPYRWILSFTIRSRQVHLFVRKIASITVKGWKLKIENYMPSGTRGTHCRIMRRFSLERCTYQIS